MTSGMMDKLVVAVHHDLVTVTLHARRELERRKEQVNKPGAIQCRPHYWLNWQELLVVTQLHLSNKFERGAKGWQHFTCRLRRGKVRRWIVVPLFSRLNLNMRCNTQRD